LKSQRVFAVLARRAAGINDGTSQVRELALWQLRADFSH